jgi:Aerotolerance regulator N-terminal
MTFLQPWLLLALPLILVPILIHLVNQWRYQTVPWAAMMFLLQAKSMHRGMAKLRQWLILAMRTLAVAGLIFAVSRPLASGILGRMAGGYVETTLVLLDRSPSMFQRSEQSQESKLETGIRQLQDALQFRRSQRWVLIDSVRPDQPREFQSLRELTNSAIGSAASASADWPAVSRAALNYLQNNPSAEADVWICSDMRENDWQTESGPWSALSDEFRKLTTRVRFLTLAYPEISSTDRALQMVASRIEESNGTKDLLLSLRVTSLIPNDSPVNIPVEINVGEGHFALDVELVQGVGELKDYRLSLDPNADSVGWGQANLPSDDNVANNEAFFGFAPASARRTLIVCEDGTTVDAFQIAASISQDVNKDSGVTVFAIDELDNADFNNESMIIWQASLPNGNVKTRLEDFVNDGGTLWLIPATSHAEGNGTSGVSNSFLGFSWEDWRTLDKSSQPKNWRADQGLLASTQSGMSLPVGELLINGFSEIRGAMTPLAAFENEKPLLGQLTTERGQVYVLTTLPIEPYSNIANNGIVLFVAVQRALQQGNGRNELALAIPATSRLADTAAAKLPPPETWESLAKEERFLSTEVGAHAGVFRTAEKIVTVNRTIAEDESAVVSHEKFVGLFQGLDVVRLDQVTGNQRQLQQEIWRTFLMIMIAALVLEAFLSQPKTAAARQLQVETKTWR